MRGLERQIYQELQKWKIKRNRKPLVLNGARQVGKTWILKEFGQREYENLAYINCDNNPEIREAFTNFDTERLLRVFSAVTNQTIRPGTTLVVLDEIQEVPAALTSLKYFAENAADYHIAAAGSLLGIKTHSGTGFPVGKVDEIRMYPMTFKEFLKAMGKEMLLAGMAEHRWEELSLLKESYKDLLRQYYYVGGMPEAVQHYVENQDLQEIREIQKRILNDYRNDFSKHVPATFLSKVQLVWASVPSQLAKENKKFVYSAVKPGGRAKEFEDAIEWLIQAGLIMKVNRVSDLKMPLKSYEEFGAFKLFVLDLGLLGAMADVPAKSVLLGEKVFGEYKGAFTEQFVAQQVFAAGVRPYYYARKSSLEIDFVIQTDRVYPIEVKAEENLRSKSLRTVVERDPELTGWRFSMADYREQEWMVNVPLYLVEEWVKNSRTAI